MQQTTNTESDLGDIVILLLTGTLSGLRDRLASDGFERASALVAQLTTTCDTYIAEVTGQ